jgi:hypothetical protein
MATGFFFLAELLKSILTQKHTASNTEHITHNMMGAYLAALLRKPIKLVR